MWLSPVVRLLAAAAARGYYRLEISGPRVSRDGSALLVANHPNGLLDPALVVTAADRRVRFLAKSTLFTDPRIGWLVRGAGAIPVYRRIDDPSQTGKNVETFQAVFEALGGGDAVGIFPEGVSHSKPSLRELKTGAARMALGTYEREGCDFPIVPIGLVFRRKDAFRSEALALLGEPVPWSDLAHRGAEDRDAVQELTRRIGRGLRRLTVNLESWEDAPLVEWAEAIWAAEHEPYDDAKEQLSRTQVIATILAALRRRRTSSPDDPAVVMATELAADLYEHRDQMIDLSLEPRDLANSRSARRHRRGYRALDPLSALLASVGFLLFWPPYRLTGILADLARPDAETRSTYRFLGGVVVYAFWVVGLSAVAGWLGNAAAALLVLVAVPLVGLLGLFVRERRREQGRVREKVDRTLSGPERVHALKAAQSDIAARLDRLYESWLAGELPTSVDLEDD